jgi:uncharacterized protein with ATP-grasp and redox domains
VADLDLTAPPVVTGQLAHRRIRELTGATDPYREVKSDHNFLVTDVLPSLSSLVRRVPEPLLMATRLAIAANVIDLGACPTVTSDQVLASLRGVLDEPFHGEVQTFTRALAEARDVLYLTDNAGEIAADRLLIEEIGVDRVTVAVRGVPVLNDATRQDADEVGLSDLVEVIDNGSDAPGTVLADCSEAFRLRFHAADLVIAKGQGNYESLCDTTTDVFFLFKVKCPVIAERTGLPLGTHALLRSQPRSRIPAPTPVPGSPLSHIPDPEVLP